MEPENQLKNDRKKIRINWRMISIYPLVLASIVLFGLFIYPTMYKYDKLDQKYPVMINRLTGEAKILTRDGWQSTPEIDSALGKMEQYKSEISVEIDKQEEEITQNVMTAVEKQLDEIKTQSASLNQDAAESKYAAVRNRDVDLPNTNPAQDDQFIENQENKKGTFSKGDSMDKVKEVMGTPSGISGYGKYETWMFDLSSINFTDGKVTGWSDISHNLRVK
ncbi:MULTISPECIES: hypothetical protein [Paenibacillus]|uniref:hypothetical protein n=1 Tax=Paenibacillus TaxID=44249 RepID=UPI0004705349|nr:MULTISPECIES: hypothetical protein [Paenibacillus]OMF39769.1 hypothetical protein BK135_25030 [Paenibacillus peoriae]